MLRQATTSPDSRLRAQTDRMGRCNATARSGATSVMGPAIHREVYTSLKSMRWRKKHNLKADASFEECIEAAITYHLKLAVEDYVRKIVSSNDSARKALEKTIDDIPEDPVTKRLDEAEKTYIDQVTKVDISLEKIRKIEKDIERYSISIVTITDQATMDNGITDLSDAESSRVKTISMLKDQQEKAKATQESRIFTLFDKRLGGFKASGKDERPLGLKEDMEKNAPKEIQDAISSWIKPRCGKYYTCVPAILRLLKSYDPGTGMYWCPHDTGDDMAKHTKAMYQQQAESLHTDLKDEIGEDNMEVVMATQMCGKEADKRSKASKTMASRQCFACCPSTANVNLRTGTAWRGSSSTPLIISRLEDPSTRSTT